MQSSLGKRWGRGQKVVAYSDAIFTMLNLFLFLCFSSERTDLIPSGAETQKIKRIDHNKCNVGADQ